MDTNTRPLPLRDNESYDEWLVRRTRDAIDRMRRGEPAGYDAPASDKASQRACDLGTMTAHAEALADALQARIDADMEARTRD